MKKLKKFAALLLVGVMALALLTACGGGGSPTEEQKVLAQISQEKGVQVTNDAELRAVAERRLDESLQYKLLGYAGAYKFYKDQVGNDLAVTITARHNYENTFLSTVLTYISRYIKTDVNGNVSQDGIWSNIGVVVQSNNEQSYIGISIRIKNCNDSTGKHRRCDTTAAVRIFLKPLRELECSNSLPFLLKRRCLLG